ncbi:hypothetical protein AK812_SmicGene2963 [Symbiodinium microadriaticum]|uniref:Uncharacterized protein n=1 Tax=Symbiodinium microadriaticum TaxID=2951 RepID=A0A1Q9F0C0_SYMMI|nr:hypothetical protein AK812_SmicGene2963 [Symbiodinium microadriaticum]
MGDALCQSLVHAGLRGDPMAMGTAVLATEPAPVEEVKKPSVAEVPLPDVKSGEDVSPQERAKMEAEVAESSKKTEAHWRSKADAKAISRLAETLRLYKALMPLSAVSEGPEWALESDDEDDKEDEVMMMRRKWMIM